MEKYNIDNFNDFRPWGMDLNSFCMLMHLSQFAGVLFPGAGFALPIIMWATNKDKNDLIDQHGKNILNWMISAMIYAFGGLILTFVVIGIPLLIALGICSFIFTIMGAIKANEGTVYQYPLTLNIIN
ncbi:MAG: DUF4870 domain-containing protein [Carboxylicivirga sp.]|jgi:uncharacterized Tic20 family protein|nr:DUF4870 domain-containing protein [Carboxylicivirga sp.]